MTVLSWYSTLVIVDMGQFKLTCYSMKYRDPRGAHISPRLVVPSNYYLILSKISVHVYHLSAFNFNKISV